MNTKLGLLRRTLFHVFLALTASPLAGGLLLATRARIAGDHRAVLVTLIWSLLSTFLGAIVALLLPVTMSSVTISLASLWVVTGLILARLEHLYQLAPTLEPRRQDRPVLVVLVWGCAVTLAYIPWAFVLGPMMSPWGVELYAKPSLAPRILLTSLVLFFPLGVLIGALQVGLGRPHVRRAPMILPVASFAAHISFFIGVALFVWVEGEALGWQNQNWTETYLWWDLASIGAVALAGTIYLAEAPTPKRFLARWAFVGIFFLAYLANSSLMESQVALDYRSHAARIHAVQGEQAEAAKDWYWILRRASPNPLIEPLILRGARSSLQAGDVELGLEILAFSHRLFRPDLHLVDLEKRVRESPRDISTPHRAEMDPVEMEHYLNASWAAAMTAVSMARPDLDESDIKRRVQTLSASPVNTALPSLRPMLMARTLAGLFDLEVIALTTNHFGEVIDAGFPVLFLPPQNHPWQVLYWMAPDADAAIWLDYRQWRESDYERFSGSGLLDDSAAGIPSQAMLAHLGRLGSLSKLEESLRRSFQFSVAFVPSGEAGDWTGIASSSAELDLLEDARLAFVQKDWGRVLEASRGLITTRAGDELKALTWLDPAGRESLAPEDRDIARSLADSFLREDRIGAHSLWSLAGARSVTASDTELRCRWRVDLLAEIVSIEPIERNFRWLLSSAVDALKPDLAAEAAISFLEAAEWSDPDAVLALEYLAAAYDASDPEALRETVTEILDRLGPWLQIDGDGIPMRAPFVGAVCAARAMIASTPEEQASWWQKATRLDPLRSDYWRQLADALDRGGEGSRASSARAEAGALAGVRRCEAPS